MDTKTRTLIKTLSYRTAVAISIFLAAFLMNYPAGFGITFVVLSYTLGFLTFVMQERIWNMVKWGKDGLRDMHRRTIAKTVTWRLWSLFVFFVLGMVLGLTSNDAASWAIVSNILFVVVHYTHERIWNMVKWGKTQPITE